MTFKNYIIERFYTHKHGVMGTVIFHLLLAIFLLSMQIAEVKVPERAEIEIAAPPVEEIKKLLEEKEKKEEIRKKASAEQVQEMLRSIAVNENVDKKRRSEPTNVQKYIDEVTKELEQESYGGRYKARKDKNFRKDSLQHARDKKEQALDSLKSTFYSGKSSVSYNLKDRFARFLPIPVFKCEFGGRVVVSITVDRRGIVQRAEVIPSQSQRDDCLYEVAEDAALRSRFNEKPDAPATQVGTITFNFVKQ